MNRIRRTVRQKSPSPDPSEDSVSSSSSRRGPSAYSMLGSGGSPILAHRTSSISAPGLAAYGGYRGAQQSLLQSVIRNLVDSEDDQERRTQRMKLESDLEVTSERLDALVQEHRDKLHGTLSTFDAVDKKIRESQLKVRQVKTSLKSCKSLLRCKREELKRLWLEDVKYKHMLQMIEVIEEVRNVPNKLFEFKANKHYLQATELLKNSVARLDGELSSVEALKDLKQELLQQKENLHEELIEELHRHLYVKAVFHKPGMPYPSDAQFTPNSSKKGSTLTRATQSLSRPDAAHEDDMVSDDVGSGVDPEKDSSHYMAVLVEALSILGRVQDALDAIQQRMEKEFLLIIEKAAIQVSRTRDEEEGHMGRKARGYIKENMPKQLTKMLQICFERFRTVVSAHSTLLEHFKRAKRTYKAPYTLYEISDVWIAIQFVVRNVLEVYLAYNEDTTSGDVSGYAAFASPGDTHTMFSRRKPPTARVTKKPLFRFDSSRHAISISSYMREQRDLELAEGRNEAEPVATRHYDHDQPSISQHLVCQPHNRNITVAFKVVKDFIEEIEGVLILDGQDHCQLHYFLHDYIERDFLERVHLEYFKRMGNCAKPEAAKATAPDQKTLKVTGSKLCVLNSVLTVWQLVIELRQLMKDLPLYSAHFLAIICELLIGYRESVQLLYKGLTSLTVDSAPSGRGGVAAGGAAGYSQEGVVSSKWAKDESIAGAIKGWIKVKQGKAKAAEDDRINTVYSKESELLMKQIQEPLRQHNVILSHENLRLLAIMHESLDWFSSQLKQVVFQLSGSTDSTDGAGMSSPSPHGNFASVDFLELMERLSTQLAKLGTVSALRC